MKKFLLAILVTVFAYTVAMAAVDNFAVNYKSVDSYMIPYDNNGVAPGEVNLAGVKYYGTGQSVATKAVSGDQPVILYGIILSSGYTPDAYVTILDSTTEMFRVFVDTGEFVAGALAGTQIIEFPYGIQTSSGLFTDNSSVNFDAVILYRLQNTK